MNLIELKGLTKKYSATTGCFDINLTINEGEVCGFIGPNGAGKTTVIRQMVGFIKSDQGHGQILGLDIWKQSQKIMESLSYLPGEVSLPEYMTGIEYLKTVSGIRGNIDWEYVKELVNYFEFNAKTKIKKMSKGMKQKVALVSAFMHKPKVLILDEPTSGLDPLMREKFNNLIKKVQSNGTTVFMSSHIFGEIENTCDRVVVIKKGKIISEISMEKIKNNSAKKYQIEFGLVNEYNSFLKKKWKIVEKNDDKKIVQITIENSDISEFLKGITEYKVTNFREISFNLEEHFLKFYQDEVNF